MKSMRNAGTSISMAPISGAAEFVAPPLSAAPSAQASLIQARSSLAPNGALALTNICGDKDPVVGAGGAGPLEACDGYEFIRLLLQFVIVNHFFHSQPDFACANRHHDRREWPMRTL